MKKLREGLDVGDIIRVKNLSGSLSKLFQQVETPARSEYGTPSEAWAHGSELVVLGEPLDIENENDPRFHNCDAMGCATFSHVIERVGGRDA